MPPSILSCVLCESIILIVLDVTFDFNSRIELDVREGVGRVQ